MLHLRVPHLRRSHSSTHNPNLQELCFVITVASPLVGACNTCVSTCTTSGPLRALKLLQVILTAAELVLLEAAGLCLAQKAHMVAAPLQAPVWMSS